MVNKRILVKSTILALSILIAGNVITLEANGSAFSKFSSNPMIISDVVKAAEIGMFTGAFTYVQNDAGNPDPAVIVQPDGSVAVALFKGTMIQLNCNVGVVPQITAGTDVAASVVTPAGNGILIAGNVAGSGIIQVQNTVNGITSNIIVNVVSSNNTITTSTELQEISPDYYYKEEYVGNNYVPNGIAIYYTNGDISVNADYFQYNSPNDNYQAICYVGDDNMLTIETYQGLRVSFSAWLSDGKYLPDQGSRWEFYEDNNLTSDILGDFNKPDRVVYITTNGKYVIVSETEPQGASFVPVHVITKGDVTDKWTYTFVRNGVTYTSYLVDMPWNRMELINRDSVITQ